MPLRFIFAAVFISGLVFAKSVEDEVETQGMANTRILECSQLPPNLKTLFKHAFQTFKVLNGGATKADAARFATLLGYAGPESTGYALAANDEISRSRAEQQRGLSGQEVYVDLMFEDTDGGWDPGEDVRVSLASYATVFDLQKPYIIRHGDFESHGKVFRPGEKVYKMHVTSSTSCGLLMQSADQQGRGYYRKFLSQIIQTVKIAHDSGRAAEMCGTPLMYHDSKGRLADAVAGLANECGASTSSLCYCKWATLCPEANIIQAAGVNLATYFARNTVKNSKPQCANEFD